MKSAARILAFVPLVALLAACSSGSPDSPASDSPSTPAAPTTTVSAPNVSETPSASATRQSPSASASETETSTEVDTSTWKTFTAHGISFKYPSDWSIRMDDSDDNPAPDPDNPYQEWDIITDKGHSIATFEANSAKDTDGDLATYQRTTLETENVPASLHTPAVFVAEHFVQSEAGDDSNDEKFVIFLSTTDRAEDRTSDPELSYFMPLADAYSVFESDDDLPEALGIEDDQVSLEDARQIMKSQEYQNLKAMMLSVSVK
ncbi:hypothetical protein [Glutamicibacter sp. NPDC087344]|uniref:hypothetical protein n=1 Tax=Glutamicibacter sp. NPDC087344 TaxID=3363994 RepID=UPI0037F71B96